MRLSVRLPITPRKSVFKAECLEGVKQASGNQALGLQLALAQHNRKYTIDKAG